MNISGIVYHLSKGELDHYDEQLQQQLARSTQGKTKFFPINHRIYVVLTISQSFFLPFFPHSITANSQHREECQSCPHQGPENRNVEKPLYETRKLIEAKNYSQSAMFVVARIPFRLNCHPRIFWILFQASIEYERQSPLTGGFRPIQLKKGPSFERNVQY